MVLLNNFPSQVLSILQHFVTRCGYSHLRLDGKTSEERRVKIVQQFNADPHTFVLLASTRAGGVGLNLTGANVVVIFDPNWNPAHDAQAQDRAYRLGQGRDVSVYRLVTSASIEESMYLRQVYKQVSVCAIL